MDRAPHTCTSKESTALNGLLLQGSRRILLHATHHSLLLITYTQQVRRSRLPAIQQLLSFPPRIHKTRLGRYCLQLAQALLLRLGAAQRTGHTPPNYAQRQRRDLQILQPPRPSQSCLPASCVREPLQSCAHITEAVAAHCCYCCCCQEAWAAAWQRRQLAHQPAPHQAS